MQDTLHYLGLSLRKHKVGSGMQLREPMARAGSQYRVWHYSILLRLRFPGIHLAMQSQARGHSPGIAVSSNEERGVQGS